MLKKLKDKKKDNLKDNLDTEIPVSTKILGFGSADDDEVYLRYGNAEKPANRGNISGLDKESDKNRNVQNPYGVFSDQSADLSGYYGTYGNTEPVPDSNLTNNESNGFKPNFNLNQPGVQHDNGINENELRSIFNRSFNRIEYEEALFISIVQISYLAPSLSDSILAPVESFINSDRLRSLKTIRFLYELLKNQKLMELEESKVIFTLLSVIRKMQLFELKYIVEEELLSEDSSIRSLSISIFGEWHEKEILQNIDNFLLNPNPQIKIAVINALKNYKDSNFTGKILNIIATENFDVLIAVVNYFIDTNNRDLIVEVPNLIKRLKNQLEQNVSIELFSFYRELMKYIRIYPVECDYSMLLEIYLLFLEHNLDSEEIPRTFVYLWEMGFPISDIIIEKFIKKERWAKWKLKLEYLVRMMGF